MQNMVSFFAKRRRKYRPKNFEILAMIENRKKKNRTLTTKTFNCVFKILNDGNTIYLPPKIKALVTLFFLAHYFLLREKKPFLSNRWFCWLV
jgi:hypothetical protein